MRPLQKETREDIESRLHRLFLGLVHDGSHFSTITYLSAFDQKLFAVGLVADECVELVRAYYAEYDKQKNSGDIPDITEVIVLYRKITTYLEAFFYFLCSLFDVLAKYTPYFCPSLPQASSRTDYFRRQLTYFMAHPEIDKQYADLLKRSKLWIDLIFENRNTFTHRKSPLLILAEGKAPLMFELQGPETQESSRPMRLELFESIEKYLIETVNQLYGFLAAYVAIQENRKVSS